MAGPPATPAATLTAASSTASARALAALPRSSRGNATGHVLSPRGGLRPAHPSRTPRGRGHRHRRGLEICAAPRPSSIVGPARGPLPRRRVVLWSTEDPDGDALRSTLLPDDASQTCCPSPRTQRHRLLPLAVLVPALQPPTACASWRATPTLLRRPERPPQHRPQPAPHVASTPTSGGDPRCSPSYPSRRRICAEWRRRRGGCSPSRRPGRWRPPLLGYGPPFRWRL